MSLGEDDVPGQRQSPEPWAPGLDTAQQRSRGRVFLFAGRSRLQCLRLRGAALFGKLITNEVGSTARVIARENYL